MPQMMPINWLISFIFFMLMFILFNIMNYYIFLYNNNNNKYKMNSLFNKKNFLWKW
uniref:ATP synthase complex subunit 8 n=1 Tax=Pseudargyria interruptella TaxID=1633014 RepID=A0A139ZRG2_9NEOP|nr:ATP synthase F0 subunit 8 [Pseudargyria interruptella]AJZ71893.1 ATP synthase F0 subunit 8 [Pseudargyria interruptella]